MNNSNQHNEEKEDEPIVFLDCASRQTRGKRRRRIIIMNKSRRLLMSLTVIESEPDEEEAQAVPDERKRKQRLIYPGKTSTKKKRKKKDLSNLGEPSKVEKPAQEESTAPEHHDAADEGEGEKIVRKSTRTVVVVRQAQRDAIRAAMQATARPIKKKKEGEEKRTTQEEMLLEAAQTDIMNLRNLERVLAREEEVKKRAIVHKAVYNGPQTRYLSKDGIMIQRLGYLMQQKKRSKLFVLAMRRKIMPKRRWTWEFYLIRLPEKGLWAEGSESQIQTEENCQISSTYLNLARLLQ